MWYILTTKYYPAIKSKDIMNFTVKYIGLENINLSELTQGQKDNVWYVLTYMQILAIK